MFKLFGFWRSLATYRVRIALSLKGLPWQEDLVDLLEGEQFAGEVAKYNPHHAVPILIVDSNVFTQSLAILEYLEERYPEPALLPLGAVARAHIRAFALISISDSHPLTVPRARKRLTEQFGASDDDIAAWAKNWQTLALEAMERQLESRAMGSSFCFGETPGLADIALASHIAGAANFGTPIDRFPIAADINRRCHELAAFSETAPLAILAKSGQT